MKKYLLIISLLSVLFYAPHAYAAITPGAGTAFSSYTSGTTNTSVTVTSGLNPVLFVSILAEFGTVSTVTYNGINLTKLWDQVDGYGVEHSSAWILANPPTGTNTLAVTWSGGEDIGGFAQPWYGVAQGGTQGTTWRTPTVGKDGGAGSTTASEIASNAVAGDMVLDGLAVYNTTPTADSLQTIQNQQNSIEGNGDYFGTSNKSATGATTMQWNLGASSSWALGVVPLIPAVSGPPDTTPPSTPTNLSASAISSSQINLTWTASTDNVGVTGYTIYRNGVQVGTSPTNSYSDTGLTASTQYTYTVSAQDGSGNTSAQSASASATAQAAATDTTPPSVPSGLTATAVSSSQINVSWTASTDNVGVTGYKIYRNGTQISTSVTNSYSDTGLSASTQYTYTVSAYDAAGNNSAQSQSASATTQVSGGGTTRTIACSGDITSALQSAINASIAGDTVSIGAGSCTTTGVTLNDKNISIIGAGKGLTNITADRFATINISGANIPTWRISGMTLSGTGGLVVIQVWGTGSGTMRGPFRIDNISFNYPNSGSDGMVQIWGPLYGLIDHDDFTMNYEAAILTNLETNTENCSYNVGGTCTLDTLQGGAGLTIPYDPGGTQNLYIEDSTFTAVNPSTTSNFFAAIDTAYGGGRVVFRHNILTNVILYAHWTSGGTVNTLWWEIYDNTFTWLGGNNGLYPMRMQGGGTGLIHDNTMVGWPADYILTGDGRLKDQNQTGAPENYCDGTMSIDGNAGDASAPGWPCLAQIGRNVGPSIAQIQSGTKQGSFPLYLWNNGPQASCSNPSAGGPTCTNTFTVGTYSPSAAYYIKSTPHTVAGGGYGQGDVDYSITASQPSGAGTHTLVYTPFTYPYPLTANGLPNPSGSGGGGSPPPSVPLPGDLNQDHTVNSLDFSLLNSKWGQSYSAYDLYPDGIINALDYAVMSSEWGQTW